MSGWTVALRGIRYRAGRSVAVLLLAGLATAAIAMAPIYTRAAQQSVLADQLAAAPISATSLHVRAEPRPAAGAAYESSRLRNQITRLLSRGELGQHVGVPTAGADVETIATAPAGSPTTNGPFSRAGTDGVLARLSYRDGVCAHLHLVAGGCPAHPGEVLISERSAAEYGVSLGDRLDLRAVAPTISTASATAGTSGASNPAGAAPPVVLTATVVGKYDPLAATEPYWGRGGYFAAGPPVGEADRPRIDAVFVAAESDLARTGAYPSIHLDIPVETETVRLADLPALVDALADFETAVNAAELELRSGLRSVLDDVDREITVLDQTIPIIAVPLVLVCWFVLFLLVAGVTEERGPELALAALRGFSPARSARFGRAEAALLVLLGAPLGVLVAFGAVQLAALGLLHPGVRVEVRAPVLLVAFASAAAGLLLVLAATSGVLRRTPLALMRRVPERSPGRAAAAAEVAVAVLAVTCVAVAISDRSSPFALLAPAMIAVLAAFLAARLLRWWSRMRLPGHSRRGHLPGMLAHAQISRRGHGRRVVLVVTVAVALLSFAAAAWDVAATARKDQAERAIGADRVLLVGAASPAELLAAVERAAPGGTAMAVVRATERYAGGIVDVVGVGTARLVDVMVWPGLGPSELRSLAARLSGGPAGAGGTADTTIPAALVGPTPGDDPDAGEFTFPGLADTPQHFRVADRLPSAPRAGSRVVLFDLSVADRAAQATSGLSDNTRLRYEVWANANAPADLDARLADAGVQLLGAESIAGERERLARAAPALGLGLYLIAGGLAVGLAVLAVLLTAYLGAGARRYELAALRLAGVNPRMLRRALLREYGHLLGLPLFAGLAAGAVAAGLMLPGMTLVVPGVTGAVPAPDRPVALLLALAATILGLAVVLGAVLRQAHTATPEVLREGGDGR